MSHEEKEFYRNFLANTKKRIAQLEAKGKTMTRAERYELDMCHHDIKRAENELKKIDSTPSK